MIFASCLHLCGELEQLKLLQSLRLFVEGKCSLASCPRDKRPNERVRDRPGSCFESYHCGLHILERSSPASLHDAFQLRRRDLREDYDAAVRMHEEFNPVTRFKMKMIPNGLRDRGLSFYTECGFHCAVSLHFTECNTSS